MLKDFGKVVVIDVMFALVATLVVLPAVVVWLDGFFSSQKPLRERANLIWPRR
jgi:predicted RND superfamily exporter protein